VGDRRFVTSTNTSCPGLLEGIQVALPAMHAKMHSTACQAMYHGIFLEGAGLPNSELSEQENRRIGQVSFFGDGHKKKLVSKSCHVK
jgi:hypothetical protein